MSYVDVLTRISQLQGQLAALEGVSTTTTAAASSPADEAASTGGGATTPASFATQLAAAQAVDSTTPTSATEVSPTAATTAAPAATSQTSPSAAASPLLNSSQQQFAARLSADTGLDPGVVDSWVLAEESAGAATARQSAGNNDWLNIGYTDTATYGSADSVWSDPVTAADATAGWLAGQNTIPGYGTASSGVQSILQTVGQAPSAQIAAIQGSGWASGGYPELPALYQQVAG